MTNQLTLYTGGDYFSLELMSLYVALSEKGIPFTLNSEIPERFDLVGRDKQLSYLRCDFSDKTPLLLHDTFSLFETLAINEYIEEAFSPPHYQALFPLDLYLRAKARQLAAWLRQNFALIRQERPAHRVLKEPILQPLSGAAQKEVEELFCLAQAFLPINHTHLFDRWTIIDTEVSALLILLSMNGDHVPLRLKTYAQLQWERPSVQAWLAWATNASD